MSIVLLLMCFLLFFSLHLLHFFFWLWPIRRWSSLVAEWDQRTFVQLSPEHSDKLEHNDYMVLSKTRWKVKCSTLKQIVYVAVNPASQSTHTHTSTFLDLWFLLTHVIVCQVVYVPDESHKTLTSMLMTTPFKWPIRLFCCVQFKVIKFNVSIADKNERVRKSTKNTHTSKREKTTEPKSCRKWHWCK